MLIISRMLVVLVLAAGLVFIQPSCAYACSCRPPGTPVEERDQSDAVFLGKVVAVNVPNKPIEDSSDVVTVTFEASKAWKGQVTQLLTLTTPGSSASCGVTFVQGEQYVVYARLNEGMLITNLCSRTNVVGNAAEDIVALGTGQAPEVNPTAPSQLPGTGTVDSANTFGSMSVLTGIGVITLAFGVLISILGRLRRVGGGL